nr:MAG TPA: hypothetical protein [Inoviridae sp.]
MLVFWAPQASDRIARLSPTTPLRYGSDSGVRTAFGGNESAGLVRPRLIEKRHSGRSFARENPLTLLTLRSAAPACKQNLRFCIIRGATHPGLAPVARKSLAPGLQNSDFVWSPELPLAAAVRLITASYNCRCAAFVSGNL